MRFLRSVYAVCLLALAVGFGTSSCGSSGGDDSDKVKGLVSSARAGINEVIIRESANPDKIIPFISNSANSQYIESVIWESLLTVDPHSLELIPILAVSRPAMEPNELGGFNMSYEIRPEATWPDGSPITGHDVAFTLKMIKNPNVKCEHARPYYEFLDDVIIDESNPKKFVMVGNTNYFRTESSSGIGVMPEYHYDPEKLLRPFSISELNDPDRRNEWEVNKDLIAFAENIHDEKYSREKGWIVGSGPYEFEAFETGQRVVVKKRADWWGEALVGKVTGFDAHPEKIVWEIIEDNNTAITAMKGEGIDVMRAVRQKDFQDLEKDEDFQKLFATHKPLALSYSYIGLNMRNKILKDLGVRKALAHSIDRDYVRQVIMYGYAEPTIGPINPMKSFYNKDIEEYPLDLKLAKQFLNEAGWTDTDGDGLVDKDIEGVRTQAELVYTYPSGSQNAEKIGIKFQENLKKIGIALELVSKEWTVFLEENRSHNFDLYAGGWVGPPLPDDMKQIWHTQSYNGGSNYGGFGNEYTDMLIDSIRTTTDDQARHEMYLEMQQIIHDEVPYIFLNATVERICIHRRFKDAKAVVARPGYVVTEMKLDPAFGM